MSFLYNFQKAMRNLRPKRNYVFQIKLMSISADRSLAVRQITASGRTAAEAQKAACQSFYEDLKLVTIEQKKVRTRK
ncbi:MAG: hypothetical protein Q8J69_07645 [Sphingobacteriaceae bacterium]|nr:hypothetical protein [Sphingobacteriaceae bacterium]